MEKYKKYIQEISSFIPKKSRVIDFEDINDVTIFTMATKTTLYYVSYRGIGDITIRFSNYTCNVPMTICTKEHLEYIMKQKRHKFHMALMAFYLETLKCMNGINKEISDIEMIRLRSDIKTMTFIMDSAGFTGYKQTLFKELSNIL